MAINKFFQKSFFLIVCLMTLSNIWKSQAIGVVERSLTQQKWGDKSTANILNAYKNYNMVQSESKSSKTANDFHNKRAQQLADEMDEDVPEKPDDDDPLAAEAPKPSKKDKVQVNQEKTSSNKIDKKQEAVAEEKQQISLVEKTKEEEKKSKADDPNPDEMETMAIDESQTKVNNIVPSGGQHQIKMNLKQSADSLLVGTLYVGTPAKPVRVIMDTGSEHLAIASDLCTNCPNKPYSLAQSSTQSLLSNSTDKVVYGSAKFEGKETQDKTCVAEGKGCINFKFLSLSNGEGLDTEADGILGLSPEMSTDRSDQHIIWSLMQQNQIDKAQFSLSLADGNSFAVLGGVDDSQVVGGKAGLKAFRNNPDIFSHIKAWALSGKGLFYGLPKVGEEGQYPAVIDTGSTLIAVPTPLFTSLSQKWNETVKDLDCSTDANFCQTTQSCSDIEHRLSPVGFEIGDADQGGSDLVFEMNPSEYLFQVQEPMKCQFAITENKLDKFNNKNFILGQPFLKPFYTAYNYENEQILLGINIASQGSVKMFRADQNPNKELSLAQADPINEPKIVSIDDLTQTKTETVATPPNVSNIQEQQEDQE